MSKKSLFIIILLIIISIGFIFVLTRDKGLSEDANTNISERPEGQIILFYGEGCPHCAVVEEYIEQNNIKEKISFEQKEIYNNKNNAQELTSKAKMCGLPTNSIGVPFLWDGEKCFIGDKDVVDFFKEKAGSK